MAGRLFTSESVTEGHPDKIADQISDSVLDDMLAQDPDSRVAVETLLTTGLVVVAGEVTTEAYVDVKQLVRERILEIGYDSSDKGFDGASCGVLVAIGGQSADIAQGVDNGHEERARGSVDAMDKQGAGDQGLMFGYACDDTAELMPLPIMIAQRLAERLTEVRKDGTLPYLRPDGKTQVTIEYDADNRPVRIDTVVLSTQHAEDIDLDDTLEAGRQEARHRPGARHLRHPLRGLPAAGQPDRPVRRRRPDGRRRPDRPQDHRRHLRRHGPPRRRRLLRQGPVEGRPLRGVRHALGRQERRGRRAWPAAARPRSPTRSARPSRSGVFIETFGTGVVPDEQIQAAVLEVFDLRPAAIIRDLDLLRPIYAKTAAYGHFGRELPEFTWERTDRADALEGRRRGLTPARPPSAARRTSAPGVGARLVETPP